MSQLNFLPNKTLKFQELNAIAYSTSKVVKTGCLVTESSTPSMSVDVASGTVLFGITNVSVTGSSLTIGTSDPNNDRYDLIAVDSSGTLSVLQGTPSIDPVAPTYNPDTYIILATILVQGNATAIYNSDITDNRVLFEVSSGAGTSGWTDDGTVVRLTTSTDKVGIGTNSPLEKLDVNGTIQSRATSSGSNMFMGKNSIGNINIRLGNHASDHALFRLYQSDGTTETTRLTALPNSANWINNGGNLGIGTSNPTEGQLQIDKTISGIFTGVAVRNLNNNTGDRASIRFGTFTSSVTAEIGAETELTGSAKTSLIFYTHTGSSLSEKARITSQGDLKLTQTLFLGLLTADPSSPQTGQIWFNTTDSQFKGYNGTNIVILG